MPPEIEQKLSSRVDLSWRGFLLYSPISIISFPVTVLVVNNNYSAITLFFLGIILTVATFLAYQFQIKIIKLIKVSHKFSLVIFILIPATTGIFRGALFYYIVNQIQLIQPSSFSNRLLSSMLNTLFWLVLSNFLINRSRRFLDDYQLALKSFLKVHHNATPIEGISSENRKVLGNLQENLQVAVNTYLGKTDSESFRKLSTMLTSQINEQIRPLSKRIWIRNITEFPVVNYRQLFKDGISSLNFSWFVFSILIVALSLLGNLTLRSFSESLWRTISYLLLVFTLGIIYRALNTRVQNKFLLNSISLPLFGILPVMISEFIVHLLGFGGDWIATILISPITPALMLTLTILKLTQQDRGLILEILQSSDSQKNLPGKQQIEDASIASFLHNSLQSELLALSLQLQNAATRNDPEKSAQILQQVSARINRSLAEDFLTFNQSPRDRLETVIKSWRGILEIQINFSDNILDDQNKAGLIVQSIEEVASNISRYDQATKLIVDAEINGDATTLTFQSNGAGKLIKSDGVGSSWFDQIATAPWKIEKNELGTLLILPI